MGTQSKHVKNRQRRSRCAVATGSGILTEVRRERIDFRAIAAEAGCTSGKLAYSPAFGCWGVWPRDGRPADFCAITPPPLREGEIGHRISADERHWVFMGYVSPNTQGVARAAQKNTNE